MNALTLTLQWVADATAGRVLRAGASPEIGEVVTDTRAIAPGDLFVALKGARFDGHDFVRAALDAGAAGAVVDRRWAEALSTVLPDTAGGLVVVDDTLRALQDMARQLRQSVETKVVAITGSAGKTTTKESIASILATRHRVVKNKGNLNNHIGLPLSLMELRRRPDVAVMELGMNHAGEISTLVAIADPDVRVWTNVGDAHLGFFASPDGIADAKAEILENAEPADLLVCNADDARVMARVRAFPGQTLTFGFSERAIVRAVDVEDRGIAGMRARLVTPAGEQSLATGLLGRGNLANVLAATAVGLHFGVALSEITEQVAGLQASDRRGVVRRTDGIIVIDDSYNSSPAALRRALDVLRHERAGSRKLAVLGEMLELGEHAEALHRSCGEEAAGCGLAFLLTVGGPAARAMADGRIAARMPPHPVQHVERSEDAAMQMATVVRDGDLVLVKGSRGVRTDLVVDRLMERAA